MDDMAFFEERGGRPWIDTYIQPFYLKLMGYGPANPAEAHDLVPVVRKRAGELSAGDIGAMMRMGWRAQVMGAW
jgi:hypothetical protein